MDIEYLMQLIGNPVGRLGRDAGAAFGDYLASSEEEFPDIRNSETPTTIDPEWLLNRIQTTTSPSSPREAPSTESDVVEEEPIDEQELDLSNPWIRRAVLSGKMRVGGKHRIKNSHGTFSQTGSGFKSPTNPEMLKFLYNLSLEKQKSKNVLQGNALRALAAAGLPADKLLPLTGLAAPESKASAVVDDSDTEADESSYLDNPLVQIGATLAALKFGPRVLRSVGGAGKKLLGRGTAKKAVDAVEAVAKEAPKRLGYSPRGLPFDPKIKGGNPTKFPSTPENIVTSMPSDTLLPAVGSKNLPAIVEKSLGEKIRNAIKTGDFTFIRDLQDNPAKYDDLVNQALEMATKKKGFTTKYNKTLGTLR